MVGQGLSHWEKKDIDGLEQDCGNSSALAVYTVALDVDNIMFSLIGSIIDKKWACGHGDKISGYSLTKTGLHIQACPHAQGIQILPQGM